MIPRLKRSNSSAMLASILVLCMSVATSSLAVEFTFELPDRDRQCFHEDVKQGTKGTLEYQVVSGGNYDVDLTLYGPEDRVLYQGQRKQYDSVDFEAFADGEYYFCFSNEFSSFSHKVVYFDLIVGDEIPLTDEMGAHHTALTLLETSTVRIHEALKIIRDYQTHHRLREGAGRDTAEYLNERVQYWSLGESILFALIGLATVFILRQFFSTKRSKI